MILLCEIDNFVLTKVIKCIRINHLGLYARIYVKITHESLFSKYFKRKLGLLFSLNLNLN